MVIGIIGENCSGKSTLAEKIKAEFGAEIVTGKDYLRMAKSESEAVSLFREKLRKAVSGDNIIYVIADSEQVKLLPDGAIRILVTADLETIKERFKTRMHGNLPAPIALMLERKHGMFDSGEYDYRFDGVSGDVKSLCDNLKSEKCCREGDYKIRRLSEDERQAALDLAWDVFSEYESPDYYVEGTEEFRKCLHDEEYLSGLHYAIHRKYITLRDKPELKDAAAAWFHSKWGVPEQAYLDCMTAYLNRETEYGWYLCLNGDRIIGGMGVIENDFHDRKDLTPNVCAVYTEEAYRGQGIAGRLLNMVVEDMRSKGISPLYLVTDHTGFYERYGWEFLCMVQGDGEPGMTRMYVHR